MHNRQGFWRWTELWASIDRQLCDLVDRLCAKGHSYMLEAELQLEGDTNGYNYTTALPGFREKGVVTIIQATRGNLDL